MGINHRARTGLKTTGGRYKLHRAKRNFEKGRLPTNTTIGEVTKIKAVRTRGSNFKAKVIRTLTVNLFNAKAKTYSQEKVTSVTENTANRHFVRQNVLTKGAVIETAQGKAKVTSRPGQDGAVNAILL